MSVKLKEGSDYLYRCETVRYSYIIDADLDMYGTSAPQIRIDRFEIIRRTEKGAWICSVSGKRFILLTARKRFACETEKEAVESMIARRNRQIRIIEKQLERCKEDIMAANYYLNKEETL